jgi:hypothetical protein
MARPAKNKTPDHATNKSEIQETPEQAVDVVEKTEITPTLVKKVEEYSLSGEKQTAIQIAENLRARSHGDVVSLKTTTPEGEKTLQDVAKTNAESEKSFADLLKFVIETSGLSAAEAKKKTEELQTDPNNFAKEAKSNEELTDMLRAAIKETPKKKTFMQLLKEKRNIPLTDRAGIARVDAQILAMQLENLKDAPQSVKDSLIDKADGYTTLRSDVVHLALDKGSKWISSRLAELKTKQDSVSSDTLDGRIEAQKIQSEFVELENMLPITDRVERILEVRNNASKLAKKAEQEFDLNKEARLSGVAEYKDNTLTRIAELSEWLADTKAELSTLRSETSVEAGKAKDEKSQEVKDLRRDIDMYMTQLDMLDAEQKSLEKSGFELPKEAKQSAQETNLYNTLKMLPNAQTLQAVTTMLSRSDIPDSTKDIMRAYQKNLDDKAATEHALAAKAAEGENIIDAFEQEAEIVDAEEVAGLVEEMILISSSEIEEIQPFDVSTPERLEKLTEQDGVIDQSLDASGLNQAERDEYETGIDSHQDIEQISEPTRATPMTEKRKADGKKAELHEGRIEKEDFKETAKNAYDRYVSFMVKTNNMDPSGPWMQMQMVFADQVSSGDFFSIKDGQTQSPHDFAKSALGKYESFAAKFADDKERADDYNLKADLTRSALQAMEQSPDFKNTPETKQEVLEDLPDEAIIETAKEQNPDMEINGIKMEMVQNAQDYELKVPGFRIILGDTKQEANKYLAFAIEMAPKAQGATPEEKAGNLSQLILDYQDLEYAKEDADLKKQTAESKTPAPDLSFNFDKPAEKTPDTSFHENETIITKVPKPDTDTAFHEGDTVTLKTPKQDVDTSFHENDTVTTKVPEAPRQDVDTLVNNIELPNFEKIDSLAKETGIESADLMEVGVLYDMIPAANKLQNGLPENFLAVLDIKAQKPATTAIGRWLQKRVLFTESPRKQMLDKVTDLIGAFDWGGPELSEESKKVVAAFSGAARANLAKAIETKAKAANRGKI